MLIGNTHEPIISNYLHKHQTPIAQSLKLLLLAHKSLRISNSVKQLLCHHTPSQNKEIITNYFNSPIRSQLPSNPSRNSWEFSVNRDSSKNTSFHIIFLFISIIKQNPSHRQPINLRSTRITSDNHATNPHRKNLQTFRKTKQKYKKNGSKTVQIQSANL